MTKGMSFYITIDGHLFEIPYAFWWQRINSSPCVQPTPSSYAGILLGFDPEGRAIVSVDGTRKAVAVTLTSTNGTMAAAADDAAVKAEGEKIGDDVRAIHAALVLHGLIV
jgi:hypothetical protein